MRSKYECTGAKMTTAIGKSLRAWLAASDRLALARAGLDLNFELAALAKRLDGKRATLFPAPAAVGLLYPAEGHRGAGGLFHRPGAGSTRSRPRPRGPLGDRFAEGVEALRLRGQFPCRREAG